MHIVLFMDQTENRRLLADVLAPHYHVSVADSVHTLHKPFDLGILDGPALARLSADVRQRKAAEEPAFLPMVLVTSRQDIARTTGNSWQFVDELIISPIEKMVLQTRVETLLRARRLSMALKQSNEDLEAFIHAMSHDLRAPLRATTVFVRAITEGKAGEVDAQSRHYFEQIQSTIGEMQTLIDALLEFSRIGRSRIRLQPISMQMVVEDCLRILDHDIRSSDAQVTVDGELPTVHADLALLKIALSNLISNAIKYVAPGVQPQICISARWDAEICRISVRDNGIGVPPEQQQRIFTPFVRLHGIEAYPGVGLGLPTVNKAVELMDGQLGVESTQGAGSTFWIELGVG